MAHNAAAQTDQGLYLHVLPVTTSEVAEGEPANVVLRVKDPQVAAQVLRNYGLTVTHATTTSVVVSMERARTTLNGAPDKLLSESFVIDYLEPSVQTMMHAQEWHERAAPPTLDELTQSVYDWVDDKTYGRAFDFASTVARTKSGDCTEHAALLTAIARANGYPSRMALGLLLIDDDKPHVFGHAWTEVWDDGRWQVLDATMPELNAPSESVHYLPLGVLANETAAYLLEYIAIVNRFPTKIEWRK